MPTLTPQQQTDFNLWLQDTKQELPASLQDKLIEDCFKFVEEKGKYSLHDLDNCMVGQLEHQYFTFYLGKIEDTWKEDRNILTCLNFLSRKDGVAVIPFLDVETKEYSKQLKINRGILVEWGDNCNTAEQLNEALDRGSQKVKQVPSTLDRLLYHEFTEAIRIGKSFNEALNIITKIYLKEVYV